MRFAPGVYYGMQLIIYICRNKKEDRPTLILTTHGCVKVLDDETVRLRDVRPRDAFYNPIVTKLINDLPWNLKDCWSYEADSDDTNADQDQWMSPPVLVLTLPHAILQVVSYMKHEDKLLTKDLGGLFTESHLIHDVEEATLPIVKPHTSRT